MILHENITLFKDAVQFTSQQMNLPPEYVEKDYWVTLALKIIFGKEIGADIVFKGGTSLSKCYKIIDRFSEDIDLVVLRREGESDSKLKSKLKAISNCLRTVLPEVVTPGVTQKMGMNRKTAHTYNKEFKGDYGQARDVIILESTWFGNYEPNTQRDLSSFVGEMMQEEEQAELAEANGLLPFEVRVLDPKRTLCEKIMSLVRFSYGENPIDELKQKIRHTYDLHQLLMLPEYNSFFRSHSFDEMLLNVARDDVAGLKNNNLWLAHHPSEALIFKDLDRVWKE